MYYEKANDVDIVHVCDVCENVILVDNNPTNCLLDIDTCNICGMEFCKKCKSELIIREWEQDFPYYIQVCKCCAGENSQRLNEFIDTMEKAFEKARQNPTFDNDFECCNILEDELIKWSNDSNKYFEKYAVEL